MSTLTIIRGLSAGIYTTSTAERCHYILNNSKADIVVVENQKQLDKILEVRYRKKHCKKVILSH